ncbi:MAG: NlpC/P60 family protein [Eubacteriales bacterium]|nr:NlpC/P60 family protein [Eubacteriales bacterium]
MAGIKDVTALIESREGKNSYTQSYLREQVFGGYSDCSSLVWKCFERALGIFIGTWTGEQIDRGSLVFRNTSSTKKGLVKKDLAQMQEGDLVFWGPSRGDSRHVEYYMGNGQLSGHGSGIGPVRKDAVKYRHPYQLLEVRRYVGKIVEHPANSEPGTGSDPADRKRLFVGRCIADELNVRTWAGTQYDTIKSWPRLVEGNMVDVIDYTQKDKNGEDWYYVRIEQRFYGFVKAEYIRKV